MKQFDITVAIATYNPNISYLKRVMAGLKAQTFATDRCELMIVDNNSSQPFTSEVDTAWYPAFRYFNEPKQGLAQVRRKSFEEASGKLVIVTDDDLILSPDYLETAWNIFHKYPFLGIFGTSLTPEFEITPTLRIDYYQNAERQVEKSVWSNDTNHHASTPWGAGMCVRKEVAEKYLTILYKEPYRLELGRKGKKRLSCEDMDIAHFTCGIGYGKGMFKELNATHLVPTAKMQLDHLVSTVYWNTYSYSIQNYLMSGIWPEMRVTRFTRLAGRVRKMLKNRIERKFENAKKRAVKDAITDIKKGQYNF
jgi:glycosyltransferase involved in cell wall biosynthesis